MYITTSQDVLVEALSFTSSFMLIENIVYYSNK